MKIVKDNRGATLVELMTSIAIFGIIAAAALGLLVYATNVNSDVTAEVIEANRVYQALDFMKAAAAESTYITAGESERVISVNVASGVIRWRSENKKITFSLGGAGEEVLLIENAEVFTLLPENPQGELKYLTIRIVTADGNDYTITLSCKNG